MSDTACMARPRKNTDGEKYRKPYKQARIKSVLADLAEQAASAKAHDFTQYVNDAVRMRLEAEGFWPPPPPDDKPAARR